MKHNLAQNNGKFLMYAFLCQSSTGSLQLLHSSTASSITEVTEFDLDFKNDK